MKWPGIRGVSAGDARRLRSVCGIPRRLGPTRPGCGPPSSSACATAVRPHRLNSSANAAPTNSASVSHCVDESAILEMPVRAKGEGRWRTGGASRRHHLGIANQRARQAWILLVSVDNSPCSEARQSPTPWTPQTGPVGLRTLAAAWIAVPSSFRHLPTKLARPARIISCNWSAQDATYEVTAEQGGDVEESESFSVIFGRDHRTLPTLDH